MSKPLRVALSCLAIFAVMAMAAVQAVEKRENNGSSPADFKWLPLSSLPPGAEVAFVHGNPSLSGPYTYRIRLPANYRVPVHSHSDNRFYTFLSGTFYEAEGSNFDPGQLEAYQPGSFQVYSANTYHYGLTKDDAVIFQVHGYGPTALIYFDPAEDPRKN